MINKQDLINEISKCESYLGEMYKKMDKAEEEHNIDDYKYFSKCAAEEEHNIDLYKYLIYKYFEGAKNYD